MNKLYCFQYDTTGNKAYRQEFDAEEYNGDYFIRDDSDETIFIGGCDIDVADVAKVHGNNIIYLYTMVDDVNRALGLISKAFEDSINEKKKQLEKLETIYVAFSCEKCRIKEKYPNGQK